MSFLRAAVLHTIGLGLVAAGYLSALDVELTTGAVIRDAKVSSLGGTKVAVKSTTPGSGTPSVGIYDISDLTEATRKAVIEAAGKTVEKMKEEQAQADVERARERARNLAEAPYEEAARKSDRFAKATKQAGMRFRTAYQQWVALVQQSKTVGAFIETAPGRDKLRTAASAALDDLKAVRAKWEAVEANGTQYMSASDQEGLAKALELLQSALDGYNQLLKTEKDMAEQARQEIARIQQEAARIRQEMREEQKVALLRQQTWAQQQQVNILQETNRGVQSINNYIKYGW